MTIRTASLRRRERTPADAGRVTARGIALLTAAQAAAAIDGRDFATPDDVKDVAIS